MDMDRVDSDGKSIYGDNPDLNILLYPMADFSASSGNIIMRED